MEKGRQYYIKKTTTIGLLTALSVVMCLLIRFPLLPAFTFLEYDAGDIPILIASFMYGPFAAAAMTVFVVVLQGVTVSAASGYWGMLMHLISTICFTLPAGIIYDLKRDFKGALIGIIVGMVLSVGVMLPANLFITPLYLSAPREMVAKLLVPAILPFNAIKVTINAVVTLLLYKRLRNLIDKVFASIEKRNSSRLRPLKKQLRAHSVSDEPINHRAYLTHSEQDTIDFGAKYASEKLFGNEVLILEGNLGSGKTTFTKGLAKGLGITEDVTSPTFNIMKEYEGGRLTLYHYDMYRIENADEIVETGVAEKLTAGGVAIIEWNKFDMSCFKGKVVRFTFYRVNDTTRKIEMEILKRK